MRGFVGKFEARTGPDRIPLILWHLEKAWEKDPDLNLYTVLRRLGPTGTSKGRAPNDEELQERLYELVGE